MSLLCIYKQKIYQQFECYDSGLKRPIFKVAHKFKIFLHLDGSESQYISQKHHFVLNKKRNKDFHI